MPKFAKTAHLCNPRPGSKRLRRLFPACDGRLRGFRREACRSAARSKSQLLSPAPLLPSQPSFCTFSITSFLRDIAFAFLVKCQPFVHDATASGLLGPAHGPAAVLRTVRPRPLGISGRREAQAGSHGTRSTFRGDGQGRGLEPDCQSESRSRSRSRSRTAAMLESAATAGASRRSPPLPPSSLAPLPSAKEFAPCPHRAFLQ